MRGRGEGRGQASERERRASERERRGTKGGGTYMLNFTSLFPEAKHPSKIRQADWEISISKTLNATSLSKIPADISIFRYSSCS